MFAYQLNHMLGNAAFYEMKLSYSDYQVGNYIFEDPLDPGYMHDEYSRNNGFSTGGQDKNHTQIIPERGLPKLPSKTGCLR